MSRIQQVIDTLEAERAEVQRRLAWIEKQIKEFRAHHDQRGQSTASTASSPASTARRRPARATRRPSSRGRSATPASDQSQNTREQIIAYLREHPGSTASDIAKGTGLKRNTTSTRLTQMAKAGDITKQARGYAAK